LLALTYSHPLYLPLTPSSSSTPTRPPAHTPAVRFDDGRYKAFSEEITSFIPKERQFTDPVRTFAYGTDASFYR